MKTRMLGYLIALLITLTLPGAIKAQDENGAVNQFTLLRGTEIGSKVSGFAKLYYKSSKSPYQRFQVVAVGLKPDTDYQLFANGIALGIKQSNSTGAIEFLFSSSSKTSATEGALALPADLASVLSIQNISIRERNLSVALIGEFNGRENPSESNQQTQVLSLMNNITMEGGKSATVLVPLTDPDGDAITLSVTCDRGNFISVTGMSLVMAPRASDVGTHICSVKATDSFGLSTQIPFVISVTPPNQPPQLNPIPDQVVKTGEVKDIVLTAIDPDGNSGLRFLVSQGPAFVILSDRGDGNGILRIAPQLSDTQGGIVTVKVFDEGGLSAQSSFTLTVQPSVTITSVTRSKPNLFISGVGFGSAGARVTLNGQDISNRIVGQSNTSITLKGGAKKLNLNKGANQVTVTAGGVTSNTFVLNMLADE